MHKIKCRLRCLRRKIQATKTATIFVTSAVIAVTLYVIASFIILLTTGQNISDAVTIAWFSFWTVEIVSLASIKNTKTKQAGKQENKFERVITPDDIRKAFEEFKRRSENADFAEFFEGESSVVISETGEEINE